jgi:UDP-2-acetamido-2,6-beta-L-arabino-hexul-4-ose reductase
MKTVLVTGADGFIGRNLKLRLRERGDCEVIALGRQHDQAQLTDAARRAEFIFHLAGANRPQDPTEFASGNAGPAQALCAALAAAGNTAPIVYASSTQAALDNLYGASKRAAEDAFLAHSAERGVAVHLFRLPNVFGKWARPNYNSAVATFCHNIAHGLEISVNDPAAALRLVYIDDVIDAFLRLLYGGPTMSGFVEVPIVYETTVGQIVEIIQSFPTSRESMISPRVGTGLVRALYSTYLSYLPPDDFTYAVPMHEDPRGVFVEMLKTPDAGQFSYFTAKPGITRGDHYHHSKVEKFLVIAGTGHFKFRQVITDETHEVVAKGGEAKIVETIPGWTHNITNIGEDDLIVMLWANEIFDRQRPDTVAMKV